MATGYQMDFRGSILGFKILFLLDSVRTGSGTDLLSGGNRGIFSNGIAAEA
jgi:hypothetical protein